MTAVRRRPLPLRAAAAALLAGGLVVGLTACGGADEPSQPPRPLGESVEAYSALRDDLLAAVADSYPDAVWEDADEPAAQEQPDGTCQLFLPEARSAGTLLADSDGLQGVADAVAPVLEEHGFAEPDGPRTSEHNGEVLLTSSDPAGWDVEVQADPGSVRLSVDGPVEADPCEVEASS